MISELIGRQIRGYMLGVGRHLASLGLTPNLLTLIGLLLNSGVAIVLGLPTAGPLLLRALMTQDMFLAGTFVMLLSILTVIGQLLSDILLIFVDPRIQFES